MDIATDLTPRIQRKPKLVFFQYEYDRHLPEFLLIHKREHAACLSEFFDVSVIDRDCDYEEICDKYQPDLTLFESGVPNPACRRLTITNARAHSRIPKLGFLHADSFCCARAGFLSDMDQWCIESFVAIATSAPQHLPAIADKLIIWPNCVDPEIYRDYKQWKTIPVLFTGNTNALYPWRKKIIRIVSKHYPSLICPHPGYATQKTASQIAVGMPYARMLNAAWFVPSCGTVAKEVVRKHFEIPACASCLVTERSPALEAAGFVDMTNCVFADEHDVVDKLDYLFRNPEQLNSIIESGHRLIMSRHTNKHRDQVLQWFNLQRGLKAGQRIVQANPFGPLAVADCNIVSKAPYVVAVGHHLRSLREGDDKLWAGDYAEAEKLYLKCANYIQYMPEPKFRLALCNLYKGNAKAAMSWILQPLQFTLAEYMAVDPDPVEWTYFIVSLLCLGKVRGAARRAGQFTWLRHAELDRIRRVVDMLVQTGNMTRNDQNPATKSRASIHELPARTFDDWLGHLCKMLTACGQRELAGKVVALALAESKPEDMTLRRTMDRPPQRQGAHLDCRASIARVSPNPTAIREFQRLLLIGTICSKVKLFLRRFLHDVEFRFQYFLPYRMSAARYDDLFQTIEDLAREEEIRTVLIVGAGRHLGSTAALISGARLNPNRPSVFCITGSRGKAPRHHRQSQADFLACRWYATAHSPEAPGRALKQTIEQIKIQNQLDFFDLVLVDGSELSADRSVSIEIGGELARAGYVVLDDINLLPNGESHNTLLRNPRLLLVDQNPELRDGFSIFKRRTGEGLARRSVVEVRQPA